LELFFFAFNGLQFLLTRLELAGARTDVALDAAIFQSMPVSGRVMTRLNSHDHLFDKAGRE
jgi:hypothetical protein